MYESMVFVVYVDDCILLTRLQSEINNVMNYLKEDGPSYNWENSEGESVSESLGIYIKTLYGGGFKVCQKILIRNFWNPKGSSIIMCCQLPPRLRQVLG